MSPLVALVEALLFASEEPLGTARLAELCGADEAQVQVALKALGDALASPERGIQLEAVAGGWRLVTKPEHADIISRIRGSSGGPLSTAALETLAIVLYRQPVTRGDIEAIRGVHSDSAIGTLLERGFLREVGRRPVPGRPVLYGTTKKVLTALGIRDIRDLPDLPGSLGEGRPGQLFLRVPPASDRSG